ncbi:hypothetical protein HN588_02765, partial [Candidatus Bathyarchaeota archaeon]|nr:hypothetical protein [Candidatus Bathyarchaeota archaeon]
MNLSELRQQYLNKAPYPFDGTIREGIFTTDEVAAINKYGYWFEAIWGGKVPLTTDKLKRFKGAKQMDTSERNNW